MPIRDEDIDRVLEGEVSDKEAAEFQQWLNVPANMEQFALRAELHSTLRRTLRRRHIQHTVNVVDEVTSPEPTPIPPSTPIGKHLVPSFRSQRILAITIAGLVTAVWVLI